MFALEYKQPHIVQEPKRKNRTHQTYRWKQYAVCEKEEPLQDILHRQQKPEEWRIVPLGH